MAERDESPDAPTTPDETAEAEALRQALADPSLTSAPADFLRSVALSHQPLELPVPAHAAIAARSIVRGEVRRSSQRTRRVRLGLVVVVLLVVTAAVMFVLGQRPLGGGAAATPAAKGPSTR